MSRFIYVYIYIEESCVINYSFFSLVDMLLKLDEGGGANIDHILSSSSFPFNSEKEIY